MKKYLLTDVFIERHILGTVGLQIQITPIDGGEPYRYQMPIELGVPADREILKLTQLYRALEAKIYRDENVTAPHA